MTFLQSILLGLIQGVAEFLPISSSGHLAIAQNLLNINAEVPAFYDVLLHLGTLVAVFVAYCRTSATWCGNFSAASVIWSTTAPLRRYPRPAA